MKRILLNNILIIFFSFVQFQSMGQELRVIDNKGTLKSVNNNKVTTTNDGTAPANPVENDVWFDAQNNKVYIFDDDGGVNGTWKNITGPPHTVGDIKHSVKSVDHDGWYLLDGRSINTLPTNAQATANSLSLSGNLPDATDRVLKHPNSSEPLLSTGGNASTTLSANNIPELTGATTEDGEHSHSISGSYKTARSRALFNTNIINPSSGNINTSTSGNHSHNVTVNAGNVGNNIQPFDNYQPYLVVNTFIYLGL